MRAAEFMDGGFGVLPQSDAATAPEPAADEPPRAPLSLWLAGALGAVLIHAGCVALAYAYLRPVDVDEELGSPGIEIGVEVEAPHRDDPADLPPGPDADASTASPQLAEQKTVVEETDLPKAVPTETDDPDRVVTPNDTKKPDDDDPKTPAVQTAPSEASAASEATAMPSPENAKESPRSASPDPGIGDSLRRVQATWEKELVAYMDKYKRYPAGKHDGAETVLRFSINRTGHVVSAEVAKSSGDPVFDEAALAWLRRADPLPPPPAQIADDVMTFTRAFNFNVRK
jgi:TonB family protein